MKDEWPCYTDPRINHLAGSANVADTVEDEQDLTERAKRRRLFAELGYGRPLTEDIKAAGRLSEVLSDRHKQLVSDLCAAGLSTAEIARILGISSERCLELFEYELGTSFELTKAAIARTQALKAIDGDTAAAALWLRNHNRSDWASKSYHHNTDESKGEAGDSSDAKSLNEAFIAGIIAGLQVDTAHKRVAGRREPVTIEVAQPAKAKPKQLVKRIKGD